MALTGRTEHQLTDPAVVVSHEALFGGTTTTIDFVLVEAGDMVGSLVELREQDRVVVLLELLGRAVRAQLRAEAVEAA